MNKNQLQFSTIFFSTLLAAGLSAETPLEDKTMSLSGDASWSKTEYDTDGDGEGPEVETLGVNARFGFLLGETKLIEIGPLVAFQRQDFGDTEITSLGIGGFIDFNLPVAPNVVLAPSLDAVYLKADIGDFDLTGYSLFPNGAAKFFVGENAVVTARVGYQWAKTEAKGGGGDVDITGLRVAAGFGIYF